MNVEDRPPQLLDRQGPFATSRPEVCLANDLLKRLQRYAIVLCNSKKTEMDCCSEHKRSRKFAARDTTGQSSPCTRNAIGILTDITYLR